jgi:uncharacterized protein (TIGR03086 family)
MTTNLDLAPQAAEVARVITGVRDDQLTGPTPCVGLPVAALLHHIGTLSVAFAGAAGHVDQPPGPQPDAAQLAADWRSTIPAQLEALAAAWREPGAWEGTTEIAGMPMPGAEVGVVAANEILLHGWDLAAATGQTYRPDPTVAAACLEFGQTMAATAPQMRDAMYGPVVPVPGDAPLFDRVLGQAGRDPAWTP